jgi:MtN3 and saliva related transmembrane protein
MDFREIIGAIAATCTTVAFLPQVLHVLRTRDTAAISLGMYVIFCAGLAFWFAYGWMLGSRPMMVANAVTLVLAGAVLVMKLRQR